MEAQMIKAPLYALLLAALLAPQAASAHSQSRGGRSVAAEPFQTTVRIARQAATISRLRAQQSISNRITASGGLVGTDGFFGGFGGIDGGFVDGGFGTSGGAIATGAVSRAPS